MGADIGIFGCFVAILFLGIINISGPANKVSTAYKVTCLTFFTAGVLTAIVGTGMAIFGI